MEIAALNADSRVQRERRYVESQCVVFRKTKENFGGLSNMSAGFPLRVAGIEVQSSEALYQACRFPHLPEVQRQILRERSPMTAKMHSRAHRDETRPDWDRVRVKIMRWCLRLKLAQHWERFGALLESTGDRTIVESSRKDAFWGAIPTEDGTLVGLNVLGRLLMELREQFLGADRGSLRIVEFPDVSQLALLGQPLRDDCQQQPPAEVAVSEHPHGYVADLVQLSLVSSEELKVAGVAKDELPPRVPDERFSLTMPNDDVLNGKRRSPKKSISERPQPQEAFLISLLSKVAEARPIFHAHADLVSEVYGMLRGSKRVKMLRVSRPIPWEDSHFTLNLTAAINGLMTGIELKYWTAAQKLLLGDEQYILSGRPHREAARYDLWRSIGKIERLVAASKINEGFVVAIANDDFYWRPDSDANVGQPSFANGEFIEGRVDPPVLDSGRSDTSNKPIILSDRYPICWREFSSIENADQFRMLIIHVGRTNNVVHQSESSSSKSRKAPQRHRTKASTREDGVSANVLPHVLP